MKIQDEPNHSITPVHNVYANNYGVYQYWSIKQNVKWVFDVYSDSLGDLKYLYKDTLIYLKDTNIAKSGILFFTVFKFRKKPNNFEFVIGKVFPNSLSYFLEGVSYEAFNLDKINDNVDSVFIYDGFPFSNKYRVSFNSPNLMNFKTKLGFFDVIYSKIEYSLLHQGGGKIQKSYDFYFAKDLGPVELHYKYKTYNRLNFIDSSVNLVYKINKVIN